MQEASDRLYRGVNLPYLGRNCSPSVVDADFSPSGVTLSDLVIRQYQYVCRPQNPKHTPFVLLALLLLLLPSELTLLKFVVLPVFGERSHQLLAARVNYRTAPICIVRCLTLRFPQCWSQNYPCSEFSYIVAYPFSIFLLVDSALLGLTPSIRSLRFLKYQTFLWHR